MKKTYFSLLLLCAPLAFYAQTAALDSVFGVNGQLTTGLYGISGNPYSIDFAALPNGSIALGGGKTGQVGLEKYHPNGALDTFFSKTYLASDWPEAGVCAQADGKVLLVSESAAGSNTFLIRVDTSGNLDPGFGDAGVVQTGLSHFFVHNVFVQSDGNIVVFGDEWGQNASRFFAQRWLPNGALDSSFAFHGTLIIDLPAYAHEIPVAMLEQPDHKLVFAGAIGFPEWRTMLVRVHSNGVLDETFGDNGIVVDPIQANSDAYGLALQSDGKIVVSGDVGPAFEAMAARYTSDGVRDSSFGYQGVAYLPEAFEGVGAVLRPDGKVLILNWSKAGAQGGIVLAQLLPDGQRDPAFGENGIFRMVEPGMRPRAIRVLGDKAYVSARKTNGTTFKQLYRFLLDLHVGTLDADKQAAPECWVYPNPVVESFTLQFELLQKELLSAHLYDISGRMVQTLVQHQIFEPGEHTLDLFCAPALPSGQYVLSLEFGGQKQTSIQIVKTGHR